jgi:hypothetical protein
MVAAEQGLLMGKIPFVLLVQAHLTAARSAAGCWLLLVGVPAATGH